LLQLKELNLNNNKIKGIKSIYGYPSVSAYG